MSEASLFFTISQGQFFASDGQSIGLQLQYHPSNEYSRLISLGLISFRTDFLKEELTQLKRPWCWERLKVGGEGEDRGWDGWMASPTRWMWVWVNSGSWWLTGRPGVLLFMGLQRVRHDWATELNWTEGKDVSKTFDYEVHTTLGSFNLVSLKFNRHDSERRKI